MNFLKFIHIAYLVTLMIVHVYSSRGFKKIRKNSCVPTEISERLNDCWHLFKCKFNKTYTGKNEIMRRKAWENNLRTVYDHNLLTSAGHHSYLLRDNHLSDLTTRQYNRELVKLIPSRRRRISDEQMVMAVNHDPRKIPKSLDWRELGFATSAVNQLNCGSCYAHSVAGSLQGQIFKQTGLVIPLSAQQLVDCSTSVGNLGCSGGSLIKTMRYLEKSGGLMAQVTYPYKAQQGQCKYQEDMSVVNITSWAILPARDERALEIAVATVGPIAVSLNASPKTFQLYHEGVYDDPICGSDVVNHAMLLVGYTPDEWILKNWWSEEWGEKGYMRLRKNKNRCGVANYASYAKV